jgi:hypothetical protein
MCSEIHRLADVSRVDRLPWASCTESQGNTRFAGPLQSGATMTCAKKKRIQTRSYGKVEYCLTKLQALCATSSPFAPQHLVDVLNAFGLFARARPDRS